MSGMKSHPLAPASIAVIRSSALPAVRQQRVHFLTQLPVDRYFCASWLIATLTCLLSWYGIDRTAVSLSAQEPASELQLYLTEVKPLLQARCYACHGALKQRAGLRLDTGAAMLKGGDSGAVVKPGKPAESLLISRVLAMDLAERMPPEHEGEPLDARQIAKLQQWIERGAAVPANESPESDPREHWAFRTFGRPQVPLDGDRSWLRGPLDAFISSQQVRVQLKPQAEAPRLLLVRRLYLDLLGIPAPSDVLDEAQHDTAVDWYERLSDRLLSDPRHGERWGRHWMDVWRYSDWWGLGDQLRNSQKHIWHWRDWIVESLNQDLPYDEMIRQMLAADELYPTELQKLRATGYLARNYFLFNRHQWMDETVEHVGKSFLGLTLNCAKCHDHKYDPVSQEDYYQMRAIFEPYHVRLDQLPGEADWASNGIPRVFDGLPDDPTYRLIRGQESQPDKSRVIRPSVPSMFSFADFEVQPVALPRQAWQPGRQPWVIENQLAVARRQQLAAATSLAEAQKAVAEAKKMVRDTDESSSQPQESQEAAEARKKPQGIQEQFERLDPQRWKLWGGDWVHDAGKLTQRRDGATRAALRYLPELPRDFDLSARFTITGGSQWRSVGLSFDATAMDPTNDGTAEDTEHTVYISANAGEPKLQAAFCKGGAWSYPVEGKVGRAIPLNQPQTLRVQAQDTLLNVWLNGELLLKWRTPLGRRAGFVQWITFDALTVFHEVTMRPLDAATKLIEPGKESSTVVETPTELLALRNMAVRVAESQQLVSTARVKSVEQRMAAIQAEARGESGGESAAAAKQAARAAVRAERELALAQAQLVWVESEQKELRAQIAAAREAKNKPPMATHQPATHQPATHQPAANQPADKTKSDKLAAELAAAVKEKTKAQELVEAARKAIDEDGEQFTEFIGAVWTPTRFFNSTKDDPEVTFKPVSTGRRTALAKWITDERNPLTSRVAVNQIWMRHLGNPLVPTVFDFGRKGQGPTHPDLLNWLASELIAESWSMKRLHRELVLSSTYRLTSDLLERAPDRENRYWTRRVPLRLESQTVRDQLLALGGNLDYRRGGPPVSAAQQATSQRRSLYFFHSNNERNLFLTTFDEALVKDCYRREQSIVPQQALAMSNSQLVLDTALSIARRLATEQASRQKDLNLRLELSKQDEYLVTRAFRELLGYDPSTAELEASMTALRAWRSQPGETVETARQQFIWVLLNHNDLITLR
jgi:hypothetical protein